MSVFVSVLFFGLWSGGCGASVESQEVMVEMRDDVQEPGPWREQEVKYMIRITAEDAVLQGILQTAGIYSNATCEGILPAVCSIEYFRL